jgi:hypothetical protein
VPRAPLFLPEKIFQIIITSAAGKATIPPKINAIASPSPLNIVILPVHSVVAPRISGLCAAQAFLDMGPVCPTYRQ